MCHLKLSAVTDYMEELPHLCDYVVRNNQRVDAAKQGILEFLGQTAPDQWAGAQEHPQRYRLWTKLYQSLTHVCMDDVVLGDDVGLRRGGEFVLEEIEEGLVEPVTDTDDFVIFTRKWNPDTLVLEPYNAVALPCRLELSCFGLVVNVWALFSEIGPGGEALGTVWNSGRTPGVRSGRSMQAPFTLTHTNPPSCALEHGAVSQDENIQDQHPRGHGLEVGATPDLV